MERIPTTHLNTMPVGKPMTWRRSAPTIGYRRPRTRSLAARRAEADEAPPAPAVACARAMFRGPFHVSARSARNQRISRRLPILAPNELRDWCGAKPPHNHQLNQAARRRRSTWRLSRVESRASGRSTCVLQADSSGSWWEEASCPVPLGASRIRRPANHGHPGVADQVGQASGNVKPTALAPQLGAH